MPKLAQICDIYYISVTLKFYLIESRVFKDTSTGAPLATFTDSGEFDHKIYSSNSNTLYSLRSVVFNWLIFTDASINITDRNFAACVNYNHLLNNSDTEHFVSCTDRNKITAAVANIEADGESVVLEVDHRSKGIYTCECRFSKMTLVHELDKYMVSNIHSVRSDMRSIVLPTGNWSNRNIPSDHKKLNSWKRTILNAVWEMWWWNWKIISQTVNRIIPFPETLL